MRARFYLDENFSQKLAQLLRSRGIDAESAHEVGNDGLPDEEQMRYAARESRTLLTCDYGDYLRLVEVWSATERAHAGVIVSYEQCRDDTLAAFAERLQNVADIYSAERLEGALIALDAFR